MKALLALLCATAFAVSVQAQSSSTTTTTSAGGVTESTTTTTDASGTITEFTPGSSIVLSSGSGSPTSYKFSKTVTYVTPSGKVIEASKIKKSDKVRVHYTRDNGDMVVDKVIVENED